MKFEEAKEKMCPYLGRNCILEECMFWETTVNGKKEVDREIIPYDLYPMEESNWRKEKKRDGYENIGRQAGFRDVFVKYEEAKEGYCTIRTKQ